MTVQQAIQTYHDLLLNGDIAAESQGQLDAQQQRCGLFFGERPLCSVLRPRFLTLAQYRFIQQRTRMLLAAFAKIHQAGIADKAFRAQFDLTDWEDELVQHDPGFHPASPTSRLDAFFVPHPQPLSQGERGANDEGELHFTEYNAETPAAPAYNDALTELFYTLPVMSQFLRRYQLLPLPARHGVMHALLESYRQWAGRNEAPRIAIVDWREVPTYSEFVLFDSYFKAQGLDCIIADPREIEYRHGKLMAGDYHITLIYKRVLIAELVEREGIAHPLIRAVREGAACMVNPFACKLLYKKASLAVLSDERNAHLFTAAEQQAIADHIPWTRRVEERQTEYGGQKVDLIPFIHQQQERLVLKPNDDYGGRGIVLGWTVDATEWEQAVQAALSTPYIVQERVAIPSEAYPSLIEGQLHIFDRMLDTAPFVFHGDSVYGCLTRLSTATLLNVTAGGGSTVPTFLVVGS
ncbi:MAG: hypothetical protein HS126_17915 [Anaerolineales bacterium]|nr:hypothetical protein [Anaerolineales bacterium]